MNSRKIHGIRAPSVATTRAATLAVAVWLVLPSPVQAEVARLSLQTRAAIVAAETVGEEVVAALDVAETTRVVIAFDVPGERVVGAFGGVYDFSDRRSRLAMRTRREAVLAAVARDELTVVRSFGAVNAIVAEVTAEGVLQLLDAPGVLRIDVDEGGSGQLLQALPLMNIDAVKALGYTGSGVTVAVIDSGYDSDHVDLSDDLVAEQCYCAGGGGCCPGGGTTQSGSGAGEDDHGHGTNVSGIITSKGVFAPEGGAPDADVVSIKVLDSSNSFCCVSDVVAALDYVIDNPGLGIDIINMSLGTNASFSGNCDGATAWTLSLATAINTLRSSGVSSFVASGNEGSGTLMRAPACIANAISVGAVWDASIGTVSRLGCTDVTAADKVTCFSNSNSTTDVFAAGSPTTATGRGGGMSTFYGTSQASPASAACVAQLLQADAALTVTEIEAALESSSTRVTDVTNGLDFPRVDCAEALAYAQLLRCGNGALDPTEECDDEDTESGDGCDSTCLIETCWNCAGEPSVCTPIPACATTTTSTTSTTTSSITTSSTTTTSTTTSSTTTTLPLCGDGLTSGLEECDDGNAIDGDCCSAICLVEACDDGNPCTLDSCVAPTGCSYTNEPDPNCRIAGSLKLTLVDSANDNADKLRWKWGRGERTDANEFGQPDLDTTYDLCIYDGIGSGLYSLEAWLEVSPSSNWLQRSEDRWKYKDRTGAEDGIQGANLRAGVDEKVKIMMKGGGENLPTPNLPFEVNPVVAVQLSNDRGVCWGSEFIEATKNTDTKFKAKRRIDIENP